MDGWMDGWEIVDSISRANRLFVVTYWLSSPNVPFIGIGFVLRGGGGGAMEACGDLVGIRKLDGPCELWKSSMIALEISTP